jgi:hypothetical protein
VTSGVPHHLGLAFRIPASKEAAQHAAVAEVEDLRRAAAGDHAHRARS